MKKIFLLLAASLICLTTISAQVSQEEADQIVIDRMSDETSDFTIYAKDGVQTTFEVITATGETLELNYPCWVYYVNFADETNGKYLIVKESNGNLLEVNAKNDGLEGWRTVPNINHSVWLCKEFDFEWSFYPTINVLKSSSELNPNWSFTTNYYIIDNRLYMEIFSGNCFIIEYISENEIKLQDCFQFDIVVPLIFICQTEFNEI